MKDLTKALAGILIVLTLVGSCVAVQAYKYQDCKKVGHSTFYCILNFGK